jgi:hypothetical protein
VDLSVLHNRVSITADYYRSVTNDLLLLVGLPYTTGYTSQLRNVGSVRNRGVELGINTVNVDRDDFEWRTSFNVAANRNEVVELGGVDRIYTGEDKVSGAIEGQNSTVVQVGQPLGSFFTFKTNGIWQVGDPCPFANANDCEPGEYRYVDVNGDGKVNADDRTIVGTSQPDFFGGITNTIRYKALDLSIFVQGSLGNETLNVSALNLKMVAGRANEHASSYERWTPEKPSKTVPRANAVRPRRLLDVHVEDGSYLRLRTVTLGYRLPAGLLPRAKQARVYVTGQNLVTWTRYTGFDPEVNSFGGDATSRGIDLGAYPRARVFTVGVNVSF